MWVWRSLGCHAAELPSPAFSALGRRCSPEDLDAESVKDAKGVTYSLGPGRSEGIAAWRLEPFQDLRLCVPAAVEITGPPPFTVAELGERTDNRNPNFKSVKEAVKKLISRGGGTFVYRVPCATVKLREEAAKSVLQAAGQDWPEVVTAVVVGAALKVAVILDGSTSLPSIGARAVGIDCEACRLCLEQTAGPPLDPAKLFGRHEDGIAQEIEIWAKRAHSKPMTWRLLSICPEPGLVSPPSASWAFHETPQILRSLGRQLGDLVLAAVADIEFAIEPFEISYGESHLESLRRMVAEEVANLLGVSVEQVMCGSFKLKTVVPKRRHLRRNSMMLQIAILHQGLIDVVRGPQMPVRKPALPLPELVSRQRAPKKLPDSTVTSLEGTKSLALTRALTTLKDTQEAFTATITSFSKSASEPSLKLESSYFPGKDMPPDQLLKTLISVLGDAKHPIRKHPQVFPMFSRISKQAVVVRPPLVASQEIIDPSRMAESIRELMKPKRVKGIDCDLDSSTMENLSTMRSEILSLYSQPGGSIAVQKSQLSGLTPKEIIDLAETCFGQMHTLIACLEAMMEKSEDVEYCQRLCLHRTVERSLTIMRHFSSSREVVYRGMYLIRNLVVNDLQAVDAILNHACAPDLMLSLDNFPSDQELQLLGAQILRRVYIRARELTMVGARVVTLGKQLDEVWTFHGLSRILTSMRLFEDPLLQLEGCRLLASVGELLYNNGYATEVFRLLELNIRKHSSEAQLLCQAILIISRLGSIFLSVERKGVQSIVEAMARHRSNRELQQTAVRALFTLAKDELALQACRAGGGVGAILSAMAAHPESSQILQEGTRALEKLCPRAVAKIGRVCGALEALLPPTTWSTGPDHGHLQVQLDVKELKQDGWNPRSIEGLVFEFNPPTSSTGRADEDYLHEQVGYQKRKGLRDEIDASDTLWMSVSDVLHRGNGSHNIRQKDINALAQLGGNVEVLQQPGPKRDQVRRLCEVIKEGVGPKRYSAQDGELLIALLGHFAWFSHTHAREILEFGGLTAMVEWLETDRFRGQQNPLDDALAFPLQSICLSALAALSRHGIDTSNQLLEHDSATLAMRYATHLEPRVRANGLRLLARLIPYAAKRQNQKEALPVETLWPIILAELRSHEELLRTNAAACALEAIANAYLPVDETLCQTLALALLTALEIATAADASVPALPLLIAVHRMCADEEKTICFAMRSHETLIPLMTDWLPKATKPMAVATAKACGLSAACTLRLLSDAGAALDGSELAPLLRYGTSVLAEAKLQEACKGALEAATQREQDAQLLVQMLMGRLKLGKGEEKIADLSIILRVAMRATVLIRQDPNQATDALLEAMENSQNLVPLELPDSSDMLAVLDELEQVTRKSISIRNGDFNEEEEEEPQEEDQELEAA